MAYGLKYQSEFYNVFGRLVQVQIALEDYVGSVSNIRTSEVTLDVNYKDNETAIVGTGVKVVVVNEGGYGYLDDLLTSTEKQFQCTILHNGAMVFKGYSLCDLNEQDFLPISTITLQFTDYLHRLDGHYMPQLTDISITSSIFTLLQGLRGAIGLHTHMYVNSTLFENRMTKTATETFLEQTLIENSLFYSDTVNYENTYDAINKALLPFGAFLYTYGDRWMLERQEDITRTGTWVDYTIILPGESTTSLRQEYNKQDGDFQYKELSQKINYDSGLKTLILNLKEKAYDSLAFNNYDPADVSVIVDTHPEPGDLEVRKWYIYYQCIGLEKKYAFRGMESCFKWEIPYAVDLVDSQTYGLHYAFEVQFNASPDTPTILNISYSMSSEIWMGAVESVNLTFWLTLDGGNYSGGYLREITLSDGNRVLEPTMFPHDVSITTSTVITPSLKDKDKVWSVNYEINLTDQILNSATGEVYDSLWEQLGRPTTQKFIISFWPPVFILQGGVFWRGHSSQIPRINYLGDVAITVSQADTPNKLTYYINQDFIKTKEIDMELWDLPNINFCNGLLYDAGGGIETKTETWISENNATAIPLMDIYAKNVFRNNYRTRHILKATIIHDGHMKPFSILTDDNLSNESAENRSMLLLGYSWDLVNGTYDIEAEEYTDEEIIIAEPEIDSSGNPVEGGSSGSTTLATPTWTTVNQVSAGEHIYAEWSEVTGAIGYRLQRKPTWYDYDGVSGYWAQYWTTIYTGFSTFFVDDIQETIGATMPPEGLEVTYRVCAYNNNVDSSYSTETVVTWNA